MKKDSRGPFVVSGSEQVFRRYDRELTEYIDGHSARLAALREWLQSYASQVLCRADAYLIPKSPFAEFWQIVRGRAQRSPDTAIPPPPLPSWMPPKDPSPDLAEVVRTLVAHDPQRFGVEDLAHHEAGVGLRFEALVSMETFRAQNTFTGSIGYVWVLERAISAMAAQLAPYRELRDLIWEQLSRAVPAAPASAAVDGGPSRAANAVGEADRASRGKGTVNARMMETIQGDETAMGWSCKRWAEYLKCGKTTVAETKTWRMLQSTRLDKKVSRMKDRRRKPKGSDLDADD